jgi:hypothetical protein
MNKQNREVILYKTLIGLAHNAGLLGITTEIVQLPSAENGLTAIMRATVRLMRGETLISFDGTADANPTNSAQSMHTCLLRLAETRAKARALRDAVNIGEVAIEELPEYDEHKPVRTPARKPDLNTQGPILSTQIGAIERLCKQRREPVPDMTNWTITQGAEMLRRLQQKAA